MKMDDLGVPLFSETRIYKDIYDTVLTVNIYLLLAPFPVWNLIAPLQNLGKRENQDQESNLLKPWKTSNKKHELKASQSIKHTKMN